VGGYEKGRRGEEGIQTEGEGWEIEHVELYLFDARANGCEQGSTSQCPSLEYLSAVAFLGGG
jgi:hypothetical protein